MKSILVSAVLFFHFISYSQSPKIDSMMDKLYESIVDFDLSNIIKTGELLKKEFAIYPNALISDKLYVDNMLMLSYPILSKLDRSKEIYLSWENCKECEDDSLVISYVTMLSEGSYVYSAMGNVSKALNINQRAIDLLKNSKLPEAANDLSDLYNKRADLLSKSGDMKAAEKLFLEALDFEKGRVESDIPQIVSIYKNLMDFYQEQNNIPKTIEYGLAAVDLFERNADSLFQDEFNLTDYCALLLRLSKYYKNVSDDRSALFFFYKASQVASKFDLSNQNLVSIKTLIANISDEIGDYAMTEKTYEDLIALMEENPGTKASDKYHILTSYAIKIVQYNPVKAIDLARKALETIESHKEYIEYSENVYDIFSIAYLIPNTSIYNLDTTCFYLEKKAQIVKKRFGIYNEKYLSTLSSLSQRHMLNGQFAEAKSEAETVYTISDSLFGLKSNLIKESLGVLAEFHEKTGSFELAKKYYLELNSWWQNYLIDNYLSLIGSIQQNHILMDAFDKFSGFVMRHKDESFTEELRFVLFTNQLLTKNLQLNHLSSIRNELEGNRDLSEKFERYLTLLKLPEQPKLSAELKQLESEIYAQSAVYKSLKDGQKNDALSISKALKGDELAIEFARFYNSELKEYKYLAILISKGSTKLQLAELGSEEAMEKALSENNMIQLYDLCWKGLEEFIPSGTQRIYVSPLRILHRVPFHVLCGSGASQENTGKRVVVRGGETENLLEVKECNYLMDKYDLQYLSSTKKVLEQHEPMLKPRNKVLAVGGINYELEASRNETDLEGFTYLSETKAEVEKVKEIVQKKKWTVHLYEDQQATEQTIKQVLKTEKPTILHVASHGFSFSEQDPRSENRFEKNEDPMKRCGLALSGANLDWKNYGDSSISGILSGDEVIDLNLSGVRLVVLSACETGLGEIEGNEGSTSLNRAFLISGVNYVISSLWSVPDKETMELMTFFYDELIKTSNIETSFQDARKRMRDLYPNTPMLWAGFVLLR